jgi:hypothetical protein
MTASIITARPFTSLRADARPLVRHLGLASALSTGIAALMTFASGYALFEWPRVYEGSDAKLIPLLVGQDALNLVVGLPLLVGAMLLARRGSLAGLLLWPGALFYVAYDYGYYALGVPYGWFFIPYIALVSASLFATGILVAGIDGRAVRERIGQDVPARTTGGFLVALALLFTTLWCALNVSALASGQEVDPVLRVVTTMDLGLQLPALFAGGVLLWRRAALGYVVCGGLLVQAAAYLAGLSALTLLQESLAALPFDAVAVLPGFVVGGVGFILFGTFVRASRVTAAA